MSSACFVVGLPTALRARLEAVAIRHSSSVTATLAAIERSEWKLVPFPAQAAHDLNAFADAVDDWTSATIVLLPYSPLPTEVEETIAVLEECGAKVIRAYPGGSAWTPAATDSDFLDALFGQLEVALFGKASTILPSVHFQRLASRNKWLLLTNNALDSCDDVAELRYAFLIKSANAFDKITRKNGQVGPLDEFFSGIGLEHAQSGGISTRLRIYRDSKSIYNESRSTHLKQGDGTTPQAAARVYYHHLYLDDSSHIAVVYAGVHPENDIERAHHV